MDTKQIDISIPAPDSTTFSTKTNDDDKKLRTYSKISNGGETHSKDVLMDLDIDETNVNHLPNVTSEEAISRPDQTLLSSAVTPTADENRWKSILLSEYKKSVTSLPSKENAENIGDDLVRGDTGDSNHTSEVPKGILEKSENLPSGEQLTDNCAEKSVAVECGVAESSDKIDKNAAIGDHIYSLNSCLQKKDGGEMTEEKCVDAEEFMESDTQKLNKIAESLSLRASSISKNKKKSKNESLTVAPPVSPRVKEPFLIGWTRELVHRAPTDGEAVSKTSDVYYRTPDGYKLRSYRDIAGFLATIETDLTLECFTFRKVLVYHPPQEIERKAGRVGIAPGKKFKKRKQIIFRGTALPKPKPLVNRLSPKKLRRSIIRKVTMKKKIRTMPCSLSCPGQNGAPPTLLCGNCLCMYHPSCVGLDNVDEAFICSQCEASSKLIINNKRPMKENTVEPKKRIKLQTVPTFDPIDPLSPSIAMHVTSCVVNDEDENRFIKRVTPVINALPRLVAAPSLSKTNITIENCLDANRPPPPLRVAPHLYRNSIKPVKIVGTWIPPSNMPGKTLPLPKQIPPLKLAIIRTTLKVPTPTKQVSPLFIPPPPPLKLRPQIRENISTNQDNSGMQLTASGSPTVIMIPPLVQCKTSQIVNSLPTTPSVAPLRILASAPASTSASALVPPPPPPSLTPAPAIAVSNPKPVPIKVPTTGFVSIVNTNFNKIALPVTGTMKFKMTTNAGVVSEVVVPAIPLTNNSPPQPKYIVVNKEGQPTSLMVGVGNNVIKLPILEPVPKTRIIKPFETKTSNLPSICANIPPVIMPQEPIDVPTDESNKITDLEKVAEDLPVKPNEISPDLKMAKQRKPGINPALCSIQRLVTGAKTLLRVFEYLKQDDLARASSVCQAWRWLTSQPELWKYIKLDDMCVYDWESLSRVIKKFKSYRLDMRKMKTFEDHNRTWHEFVAVVQDLESIKHIDFGFVSVPILHTVADKLLNIEILTAEWIAEFSTNICRLDVGIFGKLKMLKKLRLRSVADLQLPTFTLSGGFPNLKNLTELTHLSITTLRDVPGPEFEFLKSLTKLKELELGDCKSWTAETYEYLSGLHELEGLRLECCAFCDSFYEIMSKLDKLRRLVLHTHDDNERWTAAVNKLVENGLDVTFTQAS